MKESTLATKIMIAILCLGVAAYLAIYLVRGWGTGVVTARAYAYSIDVGQKAQGILVRTEVPLSGGGGGYVDQILPEGAKAAAGDPVALVYGDPSALSTRQSIRALEAEIEQLQYALGDRAQPADAVRLDAQVISSIVSLRALAAGGDLTGLDDGALSLRSMVFKRDYAYGDTGAADQLGQLIADKQARLAELYRSLDQVSTTVYAPASGVFSAGADGWEGVAVPAMLDGLTAQELDGLLKQQHSPAPGAVGKLITSSRWYFVCPLSQEDAARLTQGRTVTVRFSLDWAGEVDMTVERIGDSENGQCLTVLSTDRYLSDTTLLREQTVELVFDTVSGIRVPKGAIRVGEQTRTDPDTGEETQVNVTCVYALVGSQAELKPVEVLVQRDDYCLVEGIPSQSAGEARKILRAGDEIIVAAEDLFDGKVVR